MKKQEVVLVTGAGQLSLAMARRMGYGKKIILGDKNKQHVRDIAKIMTAAGFDVEPMTMDLSERASIQAMISKGQEYGDIKYLINGAGVTISSQSGWRMPALTAEQDRALAMTDPEELLQLELLQPENIRDTLHAYQLAKRCNEKRTMYEAVRWGQRGARINDVAPGIIVTPLAIDEFNGPRGDFYKNMFRNCPSGRPGTADEIATIGAFLLSDAAAFVTGSTFLADGGATASYYYGPLQPDFNK